MIGGEIKTIGEKSVSAIVDLSFLKSDDRESSQHSWLEKGPAEVIILSSGRRRSAGVFFVKQIEGDTADFYPEVNSITSEKYNKLKRAGARVLPTYRVFEITGQRYAMSTLLSKDNTFVWSANDEKQIPKNVSSNVSWEFLAEDLLRNAKAITDAGFLSEGDVYVLTVNGGDTLSYVADYDASALNPTEGASDPNFIYRAANIVVAYNVFERFRELCTGSVYDEKFISATLKLFYQHLPKTYSDAGIVNELAEKAGMNLGKGEYADFIIPEFRKIMAEK